MSRGKKKIVWSACGLVLILAALELFCRFYLGLGDPPLWRADPEMEYVLVGPRTYHRFGNAVTINSFGMRTHEFDARRINADEVRIMVCGDSVINGGGQTDQSQLMTDRLEQHLTAQFHRPAVVMNVSCGSWGPPNYWAFVKRYGIFEANALVIVVSSHDWSDSPTFEPVVGSVDEPSQTPMFALTEAVTRYLPRYVPHWGAAGAGGGGAPETMGPTQGQIDQALAAFRSLIEFAKAKNVPVVVVQHLTQSEVGKPETEGHAAFRKICEEMQVTRMEWAEAFAAAAKAGKNPYRDDIHPNVYGQELMEKVIEPEIDKLVAK